MGHKIFVSYKYRDSNVKKITNNYWADDTVRDYVDQLQQYFDNGDDIYKGEEDGEDLSNLPDETIWKQLKDRIYDSTLTIVMISPNMKTQQNERDQWIPWEISYSLKEVSRKNKAGNDVISKSNAILALIVPDRDGSYSYYTEDRRCCSSGCRVLKTDRLFTILKKNMFNKKKPEKSQCNANDIIYHGDCSYIMSVKWDGFVADPQKYIEKAYLLQNSIEQYVITEEIG